LLLADPWRLCFLVLIVNAFIFTLVNNGTWIPGGGDGAYYLSIGRNLASGSGYHWQEAPVLNPPGWPLFLSVAMRVSQSFVILNLLLIAFMLAASGIWFWVLQRIVSAGRAAAAMILVSILFQWNRCGFHMLSEALFICLLAICLLLSFQISEGNRMAWRLPALLLCCAGLVLTRWAGLFVIPIVCAAATHGHLKPALNRYWIVSFLVAVTILITFTIARIQTHSVAANSSSDPAIAYDADIRSKSDNDVERDFQPNAPAPVNKGPFAPLHSARRRGMSDTIAQVLHLGPTAIRLFWPFAELSAVPYPIKVAIILCGWLMWMLCGIWSYQALNEKQWLGFGLMLYGFGVAVAAPPVGRYLAPIAPALLTGIWIGLDRTVSWFNSRHARRGLWAIAATGVASVVLVNGLVLLVNICVSLSPDYANRVLAGEYAAHANIGQYLRTAKADRAICVSHSYVNLNRSFPTNFTIRSLDLISISKMKVLPRDLSTDPSDVKLQRWLIQNQFTYYLYHPANTMDSENENRRKSQIDYALSRTLSD